MKNFKKIAVALSLTLAIGIGSFAYASDFNAPNENMRRNGVHCYEQDNIGHRHNGMKHHRGHKNHGMRNNGHNRMQYRR